MDAFVTCKYQKKNNSLSNGFSKYVQERDNGLSNGFSKYVKKIFPNDMKW